MKKLLPILLLSAVLLIGTNSAFAAENTVQEPQNISAERQKHRHDFEKRLNLTEKQKEKAKKVHKKGADQIKPVMKKMAQLRKDIEQIKKSEADESVKNEQIDAKIKEIKSLNKKAHEIRKNNSHEFEKILTKEQKTELEKMKTEGRKKFEQNHRPRPPFNMFAPDFKGGEKGIFPPPPPQKFEK